MPGLPAAPACSHLPKRAPVPDAAAWLRLLQVVSVAAVDSLYRIAAFSQHNAKVELSAPGGLARAPLSSLMLAARAAQRRAAAGHGPSERPPGAQPLLGRQRRAGKPPSAPSSGRRASAKRKAALPEPAPPLWVRQNAGVSTLSTMVSSGSAGAAAVGAGAQCGPPPPCMHTPVLPDGGRGASRITAARRRALTPGAAPGVLAPAGILGSLASYPPDPANIVSSTPFPVPMEGQSAARPACLPGPPAAGLPRAPPSSICGRCVLVDTRKCVYW
jgi:hypothetical protein